jgi:hypothetical protein
MHCGAIMLLHTVLVNVNARSTVITRQSILHEVDGFIPYPLTQLPTYPHQRFVAEVWDP